MLRHATPWIAPLSLLVGALLVVLALAQPLQRSPVYTVAEVQAGLTEHPGHWMGRTVRVSGIAVLCVSSASLGNTPFCGHGSTFLLDAGGAAAVLPLAWQRQAGVRAILRRLPLVRQLLAPPQTPRWGLPATYRVQLRATGSGRCGLPPCDEALLLDAVP
jgi:hypothetical protein